MTSFSSKVLVAVLAVFLLVASFSSAADCQVPNCTTCSASSTYVCSVCMTNYILTSAGQCSPSSYCGVTNCASCASGSVSTCATCNSGYKLTTSGLCAKKVSGAAAPVMAAAAVAVIGSVVTMAAL